MKQRATWLGLGVGWLALAVACGDSNPTDADAGNVDAGVDAPFEVTGVKNTDVSIMFALATSDADTSPLRFSDTGNGGALLSQTHFDLIADFSQPAFAYNQWRIVSMRIDPCFPSLALMESNPSACRPQLRLIAQPMGLEDNSQEYGAQDHGIHLLYDLNATQFEAMARAIIAADTGDRSAHPVLGVHPLIASQGNSGAYGTAIKDIVKTYAGPATLRQMTFTRGRGVSWSFGGFKFNAQGQATAIEIAGLAAPATNQDLGLLHNGAPFDVTPASTTDQGLAPLAGHMEGKKIGAQLVFDEGAALDAAAQLSADIDNPAKNFDPDNLSCVACHIAGRAHQRAINLQVNMAAATKYTNPRHNLTVEPNVDVIQQVRAFGYHHRTPELTARTVNESAAVADAVAAMLVD